MAQCPKLVDRYSLASEQSGFEGSALACCNAKLTAKIDCFNAARLEHHNSTASLSSLRRKIQTPKIAIAGATTTQ